MSSSIICRTACDDLVIDTSGIPRDITTHKPFDIRAYSRLKYGSKVYTLEWGTRLGAHLLQKFPDQLLAKDPPVAVVVYQAVPPACKGLTDKAIQIINSKRRSLGLSEGTVVRIHKGEMLTKEYAAESIEVRRQILRDIEFDTLDHDFSDKTVLFLDDVRITGTTEKKVCETLLLHKPNTIICGYIAQFDEKQAEADPYVETRMNSTFVRTLADIADIIIADQFIINIRVLKRILRADEYNNLPDFLRSVPDTVVRDIISAAEQSGLHIHPDFSKSYQRIHAAVQHSTANVAETLYKH